MSWRLAKAREALRDRLVRRNHACTMAPLTLILTKASVPVPAALAQTTVKVAGLFVSGAGGVPYSVMQLANEVLGNMSRRRPPWPLAVLAALVTAAGIGTLAASAPGSGAAEGQKAAVSQQSAHSTPTGLYGTGHRCAR